MHPAAEREFDYELVEVPDQRDKATLRTELEKQLHTFELSKLSIKVRLICEAHGLYEAVDKSTKASLLVLRVKITSKAKTQDHRAKSLRATFRFENNPFRDPVHDPWVASYAPVQESTGYINPTQEKVTIDKETGVKLSLTAPDPVPVEGAVHRSWKISREKTDNYIAKIQGEADHSKNPQKGGSRRGPDIVWWNLLENTSAKDGVADTFALCMLVKRKTSDKFRVYVNFDVGTDDFIGKLMNLGRKREIPLDFDPSSTAIGFPTGRDLQNLGVFAKESLLDGLVFLHMPEQLQTAKFYADKEAKTGGKDEEGKDAE